MPDLLLDNLNPKKAFESKFMIPDSYEKQMKQTLADLQKFIGGNKMQASISVNVGPPENQEDIDFVRAENDRIIKRNAITTKIFEAQEEQTRRDNSLIEDINAYLRGDSINSDIAKRGLRQLDPYAGGGNLYAGQYPSIPGPKEPEYEKPIRPVTPIYNKAQIMVGQQPMAPRGGGGGKPPKMRPLLVLGKGLNSEVTDKPSNDTSPIEDALATSNLYDMLGRVQTNENSFFDKGKLPQIDRASELMDDLILQGIVSGNPFLSKYRLSLNGKGITAAQAYQRDKAGNVIKDSRGQPKFVPGLSYYVDESHLPSFRDQSGNYVSPRQVLADPSRKWSDVDKDKIRGAANDMQMFFSTFESDPAFNQMLYDLQKQVHDNGDLATPSTSYAAGQAALKKALKATFGDRPELNGLFNKPRTR